MFSITVSYGSGGSFSLRQPVMENRLPEVERHAAVMLNRLFPDKCIVLVHKEDLIYEAYPVDEPIAIVEIRSGGEDVGYRP